MQPMQPMKDRRFQGNAIVRYLLDHNRGNGGPDLNHLAMVDFSDEDRQQFAQLIGYSLDGYSELGYVDDAAYARAEAIADNTDPRDALIAHYERLIGELKLSLKEGIAKLYEKHPDDLETGY